MKSSHFILSALLFSTLLLGACGTEVNTNNQDDKGGKTDDGDTTKSLVPDVRRSLDWFECPKDGLPLKVAFFDADNTLRVSKSGDVTAKTIDDVNLLPFAAASIKKLNDDGFLVAIASNQAGVSAGMTTMEVAFGGLMTASQKLKKLGAQVHYIDFAEGKDEFRKPKTGMADKLNSLLQEKCGMGFDLAQSQMVGDAGYKKGTDGPHPDGRPADDFSNTDRLFAENIGIQFFEPTDAFGWRDYEVYNIITEAELLDFLSKIETRAAELRESGDEEGAVALETEVENNRMVNSSMVSGN